MQTDDLVRALAADHDHRPANLNARLFTAITAGLAVSALIFALRVGLRPHLPSLVYDPRFVLKFFVTVPLAITAAGLLLRLVRPGATFGGWGLALLIGPALLAFGVGLELLALPSSEWRTQLVGRYSSYCLRTIPLLSAPVLAALLVLMRAGAPTRPALAGAAAGLAAGSFGAALYALHCIDDSPLFVTVWYGVAIALIVAAGAMIGARVLRW